MTYYDELGVGPDATTDEIRESYKRLAKLLHPDIHHDERVRHVAACQMQRLNLVYETLSDPERRRVYDAALETSLLAPVATIAPSYRALLLRYFAHQYRTWLAGAAGVFVLVWLILTGSRPVGTNTPVEVVARGEQPAPAAVPHTGQRTLESNERLQAELRRLREERDRLAEERDRALRRLAETSSPEPAIAPAPVLTIPEPAATPTLTAPASPVRAPDPVQEIAPPSHPGLAGTWYYTGNRRSGETNVYTAEYIEAIVEDGNGLLQGRYRARYRIPDRTISPEVQFRFEGRQEGETANFLWRGADGSQGEMRLRLLTPDTVELAWVASAIGQSLGLGSGKAVLVRRRDP